MYKSLLLYSGFFLIFEIINTIFTSQKNTNTGCNDLIGMIKSYHKETFAISHYPPLIGMHPSEFLKKLDFQPYLYLCTLYLWVLLGLWKQINKEDHIIGPRGLELCLLPIMRIHHFAPPWNSTMGFEWCPHTVCFPPNFHHSPSVVLQWTKHNRESPLSQAVVYMIRKDSNWVMGLKVMTRKPKCNKH